MRVGLLWLLGAGNAGSIELTAAGLWQSTDPDTGQPTGWFLFRDHDGVFDGTIVRMYLKPGERPDVTCDKCKDDRRDKPWMGLDIVRGMKRDGMTYKDGTILDPRYGNVYSAKMTLESGRPNAGRARLSRHFFVGARSDLDAPAGIGL